MAEIQSGLEKQAQDQQQKASSTSAPGLPIDYLKLGSMHLGACLCLSCCFAGRAAALRQGCKPWEAVEAAISETDVCGKSARELRAPLTGKRLNQPAAASLSPCQRGHHLQLLDLQS